VTNVNAYDFSSPLVA